MSESKPRILVVGGVACGPKAASRLKRLLPHADVTIIEKDDIVSYGACGLPYYVEGVFPDIGMLMQTPVGVTRTPAFFEKAKGVKILTRTEAIRIDRENKSVHIKNSDSGAEDDLKYDKLIIATGGNPFRPPIPGVDLDNVWFIRHPKDAQTLVQELQAQNLKRAVLVGAGFINLEMAEALKSRGLDVTIVEMLDQVMPAVLDQDVAAFTAKYLRQNGVNLVFGERVTAIGGEEKASSV